MPNRSGKLFLKKEPAARGEMRTTGITNPNLELDSSDVIQTTQSENTISVLDKSCDTTNGNHTGCLPRKVGMQLCFAGIDLEVKDRKILKNAAGTVNPGELLSVMGPSGSGKTTLISVLSGRLQPKSGLLTLDGMTITKTLRRKMCYVMQQDIFFPNLTLQDTLMYQAQLRLPTSMSRKEKEQIVNDLVDELDIKKCFKTIVGNDFVRGLSGGERKRANIACELLTDPSVMLLDEPTSGLDSSTAYSLCMTLKRYAVKHKKTVVSSIHQPSSQIFFMFDKLLLMSDGEIAYFGETANIVDFFASIEMPCDPHYNPADFILTKVKESPEVRAHIIEASNELRKSNKQCPLDYVAAFIHKGNTKDQQKMILMGPESDGHDVNIQIQQPEEDRSFKENEETRWASSFWIQCSTLIARNFKQQRPVILSSLNVIQTLMMSIIPGVIWWQLPKQESQIEARSGLLFFIILYWAFNPILMSLTSYPVERPIINKERLAGSYRLSAYYFAKIISELPLILCQPIVNFTIAFWMAGLNGVGAYFADLGILLLSALTAQSIGFFTSVTFLRFDQSICFTTIFMLTTLLLGGFYIKDLPFWLAWAKYISFVSYPFYSTLIMEFNSDFAIQCNPNTTAYKNCIFSVNNTDQAYIPAQDILDHFRVTVPIWGNILIIIFFMLTFRLVTYIILRFFRKPSQ
ncbi:ABC transporter G family member 9-like [Protopterus annectens]|uniref:ABC transporter G family member 9-like n=1 Tax=Protopterus annectens TaxID=7888 RepID=UPI001CFBB095|nr:ABC transporter G family member 9-like [Protopterus annectens]